MSELPDLAARENWIVEVFTRGLIPLGSNHFVPNSGFYSSPLEQPADGDDSACSRSSIELDAISSDRFLAPRGIWSLESRRQSMSLPDGTGRGSFSPPTGYESRVVATSCLQYRFFKGFFSRSLRPRGLVTLDLEIPKQPLSNLILRYRRIPGPLLLSDLRPRRSLGPVGVISIRSADLFSIPRTLLTASGQPRPFFGGLSAREPARIPPWRPGVNPFFELSSAPR